MLTSMDDEDIEIASGWLGEPAKFIKTCLDIQLLDQREGVVEIHDWVKNNPWAAGHEQRKEKAQRAIAARWEKRTAIDTTPTRDKTSRTKKSPKKEIAVAIPKYQQPDREGNPRSQLKGFDHIWLSQPEIDRIRSRFQELNFTAEQKKFAVEKVDSWFAENPKKLAASSEHVTRILGWGVKAALEVKTEEGRAAKAMAPQRAFLTAAEKREKTHEQTKQLIAGGAVFDIESWLDDKVSGVVSTPLDAIPDGSVDGSCGVLGSTLPGGSNKGLT